MIGVSVLLLGFHKNISARQFFLLIDDGHVLRHVFYEELLVAVCCQ